MLRASSVNKDLFTSTGRIPGRAEQIFATDKTLAAGKPPWWLIIPTSLILGGYVFTRTRK